MATSARKREACLLWLRSPDLGWMSDWHRQRMGFTRSLARSTTRRRRPPEGPKKAKSVSPRLTVSQNHMDGATACTEEEEVEPRKTRKGTEEDSTTNRTNRHESKSHTMG